MFKAWILGPTKATRSALPNAALTAGIIVTAEGPVVERPEDEEEPAGQAVTATCTERVEVVTHRTGETGLCPVSSGG
jgi:hypothetical protein